MDGCDTVIHLVAIISEEGGATFDKVIHQGTVNVVAEAKRAGIGRFLHMSALGTRNDPRYGYFLAKYRAEQAVKESEIPWTIFRPSVIFGPGDEFITTLAQLVRRAPVIPVVGTGKSKFQPVAVAQVAQAFVRALDDPATMGQTYELGGGKTYTYDEMIGVIAAELKQRKPKLHVPVGLMMPVVQLAKVLPKQLRPPVTEEQLKMLAIDNCTDHSAITQLTGQPAQSLEGNLSYIRA
jgi:NADH dehydrogenase